MSGDSPFSAFLNLVFRVNSLIISPDIIQRFMIVENGISSTNDVLRIFIL
jgi:hypothetical protein